MAPTSKPPCRADGCVKVSYSRGLCNTHYSRLWRTGSLELQPKPPRPPAPSRAKDPPAGPPQFNQALEDYLAARRKRGANPNGVPMEGEWPLTRSTKKARAA